MTETSGNTETSENIASLHDLFSRSQQQFFEQWGKTLETFQEALETGDRSQEYSKNTHQVLKFYDSWRQHTGKYLDVLLSACPGNTGTATFSKMFGAADAYTKLFEFWEPLAKAAQERASNPGSYKDLWDPVKVRETIDKVFGFGSPEAATKDFYGPASDLLETWAAKGQEFLGPWSEAMRTSAEAALATSSGDPEAGVAAFRNLYSAFEQTFGKALNVPAVGKDREHAELLSRAIDRYAVFLAKNAELERQMRPIAQQAMETVVEAMAQKIKDGEQVKGFGEFVQLWTTVNEEAFLEFFGTEEFSQLQGLVLDAALDCRKEFQQLMENCLREFPIALRSELDDVCKTNYTLKKSVRALTKKSSEIDELHNELKNLKQRVAALEKQISATGGPGDGKQGEENPS